MNPPLVEVFRRADLVDVPLGFLKQGVPRKFVREVQRQFPNCGFHLRLLKLWVRWFPRHPRPLPMMRW